ncbi:hypothetical protein [Halococcus saccharolyticus]|nr:hypothetical protein [Halococcus saccharolyticus]
MRGVLVPAAASDVRIVSNGPSVLDRVGVGSATNIDTPPIDDQRAS